MATSVTWANFPCELPDTIYEACRAQRLPTDRFWGLANKFICPGGAGPGRGWILMRRQYFLQIDQNKLQTLIFVDDEDEGIQITDTLFVRAWCVTPSYETDPLASYVIELADVRWLASNPNYSIPLRAQYNVLAKASPDLYYKASTKDESGDPFSWQNMLDDIWAYLNLEELGDSPQLPYEPDGVPQNFAFECSDAWKVYNGILKRLSCQLCIDPTYVKNDSLATAKRFFIAWIGVLPEIESEDEEEDGNQVDLLQEAMDESRPWLIFDAQVIEGERAKYPANANVIFHKVADHYGTEQSTTSDVDQWISNPSKAIPKPNPINLPTGNKPVSQANSSHFLFDDLAYLQNFDGTALNASAMNDRANERADNYYTTLLMATIHKIYRGIGSHPGFWPGPFLTGVSWYDVGDGMKTEIVCFPQGQTLEGGSLRAREHDSASDWLDQTKLVDPMPIYPPTQQTILVGSLTSLSNIYFARVIRPDPAGISSFLDEHCYVLAANGNTLSTGQFVTGKLNGYRSIDGQGRSYYVVTDGNGNGAIPILCGNRILTTYTWQAKIPVNTPNANGVTSTGGTDVYLVQATNAGGSETFPYLANSNVYLGNLIGYGDPASYGEDRPIYGAFKSINTASGSGITVHRGNDSFTGDDFTLSPAFTLSAGNDTINIGLNNGTVNLSCNNNSWTGNISFGNGS